MASLPLLASRVQGEWRVPGIIAAMALSFGLVGYEIRRGAPLRVRQAQRGPSASSLAYGLPAWFGQPVLYGPSGPLLRPTQPSWPVSAASWAVVVEVARTPVWGFICPAQDDEPLRLWMSSLVITLVSLALQGPSLAASSPASFHCPELSRCPMLRPIRRRSVASVACCQDAWLGVNGSSS